MRAYKDAVGTTEYDRATGMYAFATKKGAMLLHTALREASALWPGAMKRWIISIDSGVTEPDALRYLLSQPRTEVRVPHAEELLTGGLRPIRRYHPKTLLLEKRIVKYQPSGLVVGSANLTISGLSLSHEHVVTHVLHAIGASRCQSVQIDQSFAECEGVIQAATVIGLSFVDRYEEARPSTAPPAEDPENEAQIDQISQSRPVVPITKAAALAAASSLWADVEYVVANRGQNAEGNQIDLQRGSRVFFGFGDGALPKNSPIGSIQIQYGSHFTSCNMRFGNNSMDKLDLPIPGQEGPQTYTN